MALLEPVEGARMPAEGPLVDRFGRVHTYLRVSVTDRCNFRCTYCMPAEGLEWLPREHLLSYEEHARIVGAFARMGVRRVRLTGGEPTLRRDIEQLVERIASTPGIEDVAMTTNGHAFAQKADALVRAGLTRINVSLDALDPELFARITRGGRLDRVLASIDRALELGLRPVKINCVVIGGENEHEVERMVEHFAARPGTQVRFIEYMPFGGNGGQRRHVPARVLRERLEARYGMTPVPAQGGGPSRDWRLDNGLVVGFISPITEHFCDACNRLRLQADGSLRTCLSRDRAPNLRDLLRSGVDDTGLEAAIRAQLWGKVAGHEAHLDGDFRAFEGVMTRVGG
ncbi:MAG: GTP 3',8-cyclase MoaA [Alphaproteobacteria bacterium]|nr:GTP 3',8-cyclase MoaA [Alphaproteobacteria bacterium]